MAIYTISDLHLSFSSDKPMNVFGGTWQNHEALIKENWLLNVNHDDTVVLPGDHSWALRTEDAIADLKFINDLPGHKILIKGNHDLWWSTSKKMEELKIKNGLSSLTFLYNDSISITSGDKIHVISGTRGWLCPGDKDYKASRDEKIYTREAGRLLLSLKKASSLMDAIPEPQKGFLFVFMHYPPYNEQKDTLFTKHIEAANAAACYYGHIHGFPAGERIQARRSDVVLYPEGTVYNLVSCDYTGNKLIKVAK